MSGARRILSALVLAGVALSAAACSLAIDFSGLDDGPPDAHFGDAGDAG